MIRQNDARKVEPAEGFEVDGAERVREAIAGLRYGEVRVVIQDGVVVRIERTEKLQIDRQQRRGGR